MTAGVAGPPPRVLPRLRARRCAARGSLLVLAVAALGGIAAGQDAPAEPTVEPTAEELRAALIETLPRLVLGENDVRTLDIDGIFGPVRQRFSLRARGAGDYDVVVSDVDDGEPFVVGRDGVSLAYLPGEERGCVEVFPGHVYLELGMEGERLRCRIGLQGGRDAESPGRVSVDVDPVSILRNVTEDLSVVRGADGCYRLRGASATGSVAELDVDPRAAYPVTALLLRPPGEDEAVLELSRIAVNVAPGPRIVGIPTPEALAAHFDVEDLRLLDDEDQVTARSMGAFVRAAGARMRIAATRASEDPAERAQSARDARDRAALGRLVRAAAGPE